MASRKMEKTCKVRLYFLTLTLSIFLTSIKVPEVTANTWVGSRYQIECTMCSACDNPCDTSPPPPSTPSSIRPPPPSPPSSGNYYPSPPPPAAYSYAPPVIDGFYPPPPYRNFPGPPPPHPIMPYFPYYYYSPPPPSPSGSVKLTTRFVPHAMALFLSLLCLF
ncbi:leucine-rich repeat extensin-like protein 3 [Actinidia eriantha]|uniref:leucine-rich repeat extensin-like protein 3 n=1 Tax=Actinidia eriantha TaxID=165200 RepID=UPI00258662F2|nr:leucine-rich repeat extensin-like protein 3 [Actinidia eriantha]